jgi:hypothetical protein
VFLYLSHEYFRNTKQKQQQTKKKREKKKNLKKTTTKKDPAIVFLNYISKVSLSHAFSKRCPLSKNCH